MGKRVMKKMWLIERLLRVAGKENFRLDERISFGRLLNIFGKYGGMLARGRLFSLSCKNISKQVFIGRHVKIRCRKELFIGSKAKLHDFVYIDALSEEGVKIGDRVVLGRGTRIECSGSLQQIGKGIRIGKRTSFANDCFFGAAGGIDIGEDVVAGQFIRFHSEDHIYSDKNVLIKDQGVVHKGIKIGNNCWIGSGAVFLDGAEIGDGCVVAANAVVRGKFSENSVIGGVPARLIKKR